MKKKEEGGKHDGRSSGWLKVGGVVAVIALAVVGAFVLPLSEWVSQLIEWMQAAGPTGAIAYAVIYILAAILMLPASILTAGAGLAYGPVWGTLLVSPVSVLAATLAFLLGRTIARGWIAKRTANDPKFRAVDAAIGKQGLKIVLLLRLSPVFPFNVLNYALGVTGVRLRDYVLGSFVGMLPGTILYVYLGSVVGNLSGVAHGASEGSAARTALSVAGLLATVAVTIFITRVARRALAAELEPSPSEANPVAPVAPVAEARSMKSASESLLQPDDTHNRALIEKVHPAGWKNPEPSDRYNLVVIGAGTAGLVSAVGARGLGAKVAIIERHAMGGDCLNYGCVPSKALISAARAAAAARTAAQFGVNTGSVSADFSVAMDRLRRLRAELAENDSVARLSGLGIDVFLGQARFVARDEVEVDGRRLRFTRAIIATGARASVPSIPGLVEAGFLTNESVFSLTVLPVRLVVIGAGPIGCELAQAFRRFGSEVTLVGDGARILPREDPDAAAVLATAFEREGIKTLLNAKVTRVDGQGGSGERRLVIEQRGAEIVLGADAVLVSVGRTPNVDGLDLERAGISSNPQGVIVNDQQRTANRRVFAIGDVASRFKFTHAADAMARLAIQNALFFGRKKASALVIPWATYTEPEVAHVGLTADEAAKRPDVKSFTVELAQNDRALLDGQSEGFTRIHADKRGRILGATMVASHAGEMIGEMSLAMTAGVRLSTLGQTIHPYPTQSEAWKKLGDAWSRTRVTPRVRAAFDRFLRWRR